MSNNKIKVAFLDRDGVINKEVNYLHNICDFEFTENCIDGLKEIRNLGYEIVIITNQAGIARGYYSEQQYQKLTNWYRTRLKEEGVDILDIFHCPHHPEGRVESLSRECNCRKPSPGMIEQACAKYPIDLMSSILVGDKNSDMYAAIRAGIPLFFLVQTGYEVKKPVDTAVVSETLLSVSNFIKLHKA
ncbi:D-glycero-beta-D-manno-heptose 1,7-bisphosphate 7-phosphatase [Aeromonas lacus]